MLFSLGNNMKNSIFSLVLVAAVMLVWVGPASSQDAGESYTIGYLNFYPIDSFKSQLTELGYIEGENIDYVISPIENTGVTESEEEFGARIRGLVRSGVDVFVTNTDNEAVMVAPYTNGLPVVFARSDDPVATGAVASLLDPGSHMTGTVTNRPHERRLQLLTEINPATQKVLYVYSIIPGNAPSLLQETQAVAEQLGVELVPVPISDTASAIAGLSTIPEDVDWIFITPLTPIDEEFSALLVTLSLTHQAGVAWYLDLPLQGYVVGYGPDLNETERQAARIVDRILRGAEPAEMPVETAENYLMIDLEAAAAINLQIPESILRQADVIVRPGYYDTAETDLGS